MVYKFLPACMRDHMFDHRFSSLQYQTKSSHTTCHIYLSAVARTAGK